MSRRLFRAVLALGTLMGMLTAPAVAFAQAGGEIEIAQVNTSRYGEGGQTTMVVEFRRLSEDVDPGQITVTVNGEAIPAEDVTVEAGAVGRVPLGVVLAIDTSGSMEGEPMEAAKQAAISFVQQKRADDFVAVVGFADEVNVVSKFTNNTAQLVERIESLEPTGATALYDAVVTSSGLFGETTESSLRRNIIVLSDGADNGSVADLEQVLSTLAASEIRTFGIALESEDFQPDELEQITLATGGLFLSTSDPQELSGVYGRIQQELNRAVVLRFKSPVTDPGSVEFGIQYASLTQAQTAEVPGYVAAPPPTTPATTTTIALAPPEIITYPAVATFLPREILPLVAALGVMASLGLFVWILAGRQNDGPRRVERLAAYGRRGAQVEEQRSFLQRIPLLNRFSSAAEEQVRKRGLLNAVNSTLEQANLPLSAGEAIASAFGLAAVIGLVTGVVTLNPIIGIVIFLVVVGIVFAGIRFIGGREKRKFEKQLPDTLTLISTSLRAGYSLLQAVEAVAQEAPNPTAREFGRAIAEARLGRQVTDALNGVTERTQSQDFEWAVMAVDIQREVGGNLAEVLQTVADTMLARNRLRGEIKALTAEGRISAIVLGVLPFGVGGFLWSSNPDYMRPLFQDTTGRIALGAVTLLMGAGFLWLRKIVNIEV